MSLPRASTRPLLIDEPEPAVVRRGAAYRHGPLGPAPARAVEVVRRLPERLAAVEEVVEMDV